MLRRVKFRRQLVTGAHLGPGLKSNPNHAALYLQGFRETELVLE